MRKATTILTCTAALQADVYFADPYSVWPHGSNENANALVRNPLPRSPDFTTITDEQLRRIDQQLDTWPRKILGFKNVPRHLRRGIQHSCCESELNSPML